MKSKLKVVELELKEKGITVCPRVGVTVTIRRKGTWGWRILGSVSYPPG